MEYKLKNEESGTCLECGTYFNGRRDKKFCCLECKNAYHNRRHQLIRQYKADTLKKISKNYEILEMLLVEKIKSAELPTLMRLGFEPNCFTSCHKSQKHHTECYCFDIAYSITDRKIFNIERLELTKP